MRRAPSRGARKRERIVARLDRAAYAMNPVLLLVATMLVVIDLSCFIAIKLAGMPMTRMEAAAAGAPSSAVGAAPRVGVTMDIH